MAVAAGTSVGETVGLSTVADVAVALGLVVLAIIALAWALRRLQGGAAAANAQLRVVAALSVGPRERVLVVDAAGTQLLLGVTATRISLLHEFPQPVVATERPVATEFAARLRQAIGKGPGP